MTAGVRCLRHDFDDAGRCRRCGTETKRPQPGSARKVPEGYQRALDAQRGRPGAPDAARWRQAFDAQRRGLPSIKPWRHGVPPTPQRITMALDMKSLYGPEVDRACGVEEPAVDLWEAGLLVPTVEQVTRLARLTDFPMSWFWLPPAEPIKWGFMCGEDGCESLAERAEDGGSDRLF